VNGGQVGATQVTVSDVEHARSLATPSMGCATARARAAAPPARLAAESAQETPEEQSPAQARRQSPRVGRASLCGQFGRPAMQTSPEALRCAAANEAQRSRTNGFSGGRALRAAPHALQSAMTQSAHGRDEHAAVWSVLHTPRLRTLPHSRRALPAVL
jgi:hypothetical protein